MPYPGHFSVEINRQRLYRVPDPRDNPFLPWPPKRPSTLDDVTGSFQVNGTLGEVSEQIKTRLTPKGYQNLQYFSVPGGFAIATQLERVGRRGKVVKEDRWTKGKRAKIGSLEDYWRSLMKGEDDRFRTFVFIVTDEDIMHDRDPVTELDLNVWKSNARPALSKQRAAAVALPGTRVWMYVYEFEAAKDKDAELIQNGRDPLENQENKAGVGLP